MKKKEISDMVKGLIRQRMEDIKSGEFKGEQAIIIDTRNNIVAFQLAEVNETIFLSEDDVEPI